MRCPHCDNDTNKILLDTSMPTIGSACPADILARSRRATLQIRWCPACGLGFNGSPLSDEELSFIYDNYLYISPRRGIGVSKYHGIIELIEKSCLKNGRLVEIGCSEGYLLDQMRTRGFTSLIGIEPGPQAKEATELGFTVHQCYFTKNTFAPNSVDTFVLMHVFEHLPDPAQTLAQMRDALSPGGRIVIEVPDFCGFHHQHLLYLSETFMRRLCTDLRLKCCEVHADGTILRVLLAHAADPVAEAPRSNEDLSARSNAAASSWTELKRSVEATLRDAKGPVVWWGAGSASVTMLNMCDPQLLSRIDLTVVDGDAKKCGLGMPGIDKVVRPASELAGQHIDTLIIASSFTAEIGANADTLGIVRRKTAAHCP